MAFGRLILLRFVLNPFEFQALRLIPVPAARRAYQSFSLSFPDFCTLFFGLASANDFSNVWQRVLRKTGAINSLPLDVSDTMRTPDGLQDSRLGLPGLYPRGGRMPR